MMRYSSPGWWPAGLTCDVDAAVQSGQREAPLVVVGEVWERRPPLWRGEGGQRRARYWAPPTPVPLLLGGCCPFASGRGGWGLSRRRAGGGPRGQGQRWPWVPCAHCCPRSWHDAPQSRHPDWTQDHPRVTERTPRPGGCSPHPRPVIGPVLPKWVIGPTSVRGGDRLRSLISSHSGLHGAASHSLLPPAFIPPEHLLCPREARSAAGRWATPSSPTPRRPRGLRRAPACGMGIIPTTQGGVRTIQHDVGLSQSNGSARGGF